jgi:hypothetical protein
MTPDSRYLLQQIDCNCNECKHMTRDMDKYNYWKEKDRQHQLAEFERNKAKAIKSGNPKANKMQFQHDTSGLISYGKCIKFNKGVSFIPNVCQIETQQCFEHRNNKNIST